MAQNTMFSQVGSGTPKPYGSTYTQNNTSYASGTGPKATPYGSKGMIGPIAPPTNSLGVKTPQQVTNAGGATYTTKGPDVQAYGDKPTNFPGYLGQVAKYGIYDIAKGVTDFGSNALGFKSPTADTPYVNPFTAPYQTVPNSGEIIKHNPDGTVANNSTQNNNTGGSGNAPYGPAQVPNAVKSPDDASNKYNTQTGQINPKYSGYTAPAASASANNPPQQGSGSTDTSGNATFPGMVNRLSNQQPISSYQKLQDQIAANLEQQKNKANENKQKQMSALGDSGWMTQATGRQGMLQGQYNTAQEALAQQGAGLSTQLGAANTQQGLQQTGLTSAAGLAQPQGNTAYFGNPLTGNTVGAGGGNIYGLPTSTGNDMMDKTVFQALQRVAAGGDPTSIPEYSAVVALNNPKAIQAYNDGVTAIKGGGYNPTTASATAQTNASQAAAYAKQASDLSVTLNTLGSIGNLTTTFLQKSGLNPDTSPFLNAMQNTTIGQLKNPATIATYNDLVNQVQTYATQIYASTGMTPTDAGALAKGINIDGMTGNALQSFLSNLDTIGRKKWDELDKASKAAASSPGAYTGNSASAGSQLQTTPNSNQYYGQGNVRAEQAAGAVGTFTGDFATAGTALLKLIHL